MRAGWGRAGPGGQCPARCGRPARPGDTASWRAATGRAATRPRPRRRPIAPRAPRRAICRRRRTGPRAAVPEVDELGNDEKDHRYGEDPAGPDPLDVLGLPSGASPGLRVALDRLTGARFESGLGLDLVRRQQHGQLGPRRTRPALHLADEIVHARREAIRSVVRIERGQIRLREEMFDRFQAQRDAQGVIGQGGYPPRSFPRSVATIGPQAGHFSTMRLTTTANAITMVRPTSAQVRDKRRVF